MGACVVMDKLSAHHVGGIKEMIAAGAKIVYLPLYSPDRKDRGSLRGGMCLAPDLLTWGNPTPQINKLSDSESVFIVY